MDERISDAKLIEALEENRCNIGATARALGLRRSDLKLRIDKNPQLTLLIEDFREEILDKAEDNVAVGVLAGDKGTSQFALQTIGKSRGYHTGVAGVGKDGEIVIQIQRFGDAPAEQVPALPHSALPGVSDA